MRVLDIFEGGTLDFHPDGLFSTLIFGRVGDERRDARFSYIDIKVSVMHPIFFALLTKMKRLYGDILSGTGYAKWDPEVKDFVKASSAGGGQTGYAFFISHWLDIDFQGTKSIRRDQGIQLIEKYKHQAMTDKIIVLPAGLRELEIDEYNRRTEDEINPLYRRILALSNTIHAQTVQVAVETVDIQRYQLQLAFNAVYDQLTSLIEGKKKLLLGKWASRRIFNGTRNVITAMEMATPYVGGKGAPGFNHTVIGLYQYLKASLPVSMFQIRQFLTPMFPDINSAARLVDKKTLQAVEIVLASKYYDQWMTNAGIEKIISMFSEETVRDKPLEIDGKYLALIYKGPDGTFRVMHSIDELPPTRSKEHVHPMTFAELLYLSVYEKAGTYPMTVTRYPITGIGSIYPSKTYLKVTLKSEKRVRLDENWQPMSEDHTAFEFPLAGNYVNSLIPHPSRLGNLGADYDGDTASGNVLYSEEAIAECERFFQTRRAYVGTNGQFINRTGVYTVDLVLANMTG